MFAFGLGLVVANGALPSTARACGGTFCDAGPTAMPVDQTGETILFVADGDFVEAHIQVDFAGEDTSRFSWIVPVPQVPEVQVGTWALVEAALDATVPTYSFRVRDQCFAPDPDSGDGGNPGGFITMSDGGGSPPPAPDVVEQGSVGALDYAVLSGGSLPGLVTWLESNAYAVDPQSIPILADYLDTGSVFVAFKLTAGAEAGQIHPVVVRYPGTEPCIPIRLTRIAARDDMPIRALFFSDQRVVSSNYRHVRLNRTRLDWRNNADNYDAIVSEAIDEAGGRAFLTEYAGPNPVDPFRVDPTVLEEVADSLPDASAVQMLQLLAARQLMECNETECGFDSDPLRGLVTAWIPVPDEVSEGEFYGCPDCFAPLIDADAYDPVAFAADFHELVVAPMQGAAEIVATWPYVTRLYTRISPHEMVTDPVFMLRDDLGDVDRRYGAEQEDECCGSFLRLPGGRQIALTPAPQWGTAMPAAERIEEVSARGDFITLVNHTGLIDELIATHNGMQNCRDIGGDNESPGRTNTPVTGGEDPGATGHMSAPYGCQCRAGPDHAGFGPWWLGLLVVARRRRRSR